MIQCLIPALSRFCQGLRSGGKGEVSSQILAATSPERGGFLAKWYEELYTLLEALLENHYLKHYSE